LAPPLTLVAESSEMSVYQDEIDCLG